MITVSSPSEATILLTVKVLRGLIPRKYRDEVYTKAIEEADEASDLWAMWDAIVDALLRNGWFTEQGLVARIN